MEKTIPFLNNPLTDYIIRFAASLSIGFLIGLEREFSKPAREKQFAGVRTHSLISIFGFLAAFLAEQAGPWLLVAAFTGLIALVVASYMQLSGRANQAGGTSEITSLITFLLAILIFHNHMLMAVIIAVMVLLLLTFKPPLHLLAKKITRTELLAIVQFIIISAIFIPFLPDKNFGPYETWNLKDIWKMVVLVSGISLSGYLLSRLLGNRGILLSGILGGLASSTLVTLVYSKRSKEATENISIIYALAIVCACTMMFPRILFEIYIINRHLVMGLVPAFAVIVATGSIVAFFIYKSKKGSGETQAVPPENPLNLGTAIKFALIYAGVLWLVKFFNEQYGESGTYAAGIISGFADLDAITISMARSGLDQQIINKTILLATLSNTIVKLLLVLILGNNVLRKRASMGLGALLVAGIVSFLFLL